MVIEWFSTWTIFHDIVQPIALRGTLCVLDTLLLYDVSC